MEHTLSKFSNPYLTRDGHQRAFVEFSGFKTLWFNTGTLCNIACSNCYIESSPRNDRLIYLSLKEVVEYLNELKGFECQPADGAFYVFPNIQEAIEVIGVADDVQFCERLLTETGVALVPGSAFGAANHLRFSFAADLDTLEKALDRMKTFLAA